MRLERTLTYVVFQEDAAFVARCLDVEVASEGDTEAEAVAHLREALELHFEGRLPCLAALPRRTYSFGQVLVRVTRT